MWWAFRNTRCGADRSHDRRLGAGGARHGIFGRTGCASSPPRPAASWPESAAPSCRSTTPGSWSEGLSSGQGLMAVALVIFARWNPLACFGAALLFGAAGALGPALQSVGHHARLLFLQRRPIPADASHHDRLGLTEAIAEGRAGRTVDHQIARHEPIPPRPWTNGSLPRWCRRITIAADPYPWPFDGALRPANTALLVIDMQVDFCAAGGYVDSMGYDISLTRAPIGPIQRVLTAMRARAITSSTPARATGPTSPTCRPTSAGGRGGSAPASATRAHAAAFSCAANRAGRSSPSSRRAGRTDHRQARQGLVLRDGPRTRAEAPRHPQHRADRRHHGCLRPHDDAGRERSRI